MSKIVKSPYATVTGQRTIHTIPVVRVVNPASVRTQSVDGRCLENGPSSEAVIEQARLEADRILETARREAAAVVEEANRQAETVLQSAQQKAKRMVEEAREAGYESGFADGRAAGEAAYRDKIEQVLAMMRQLEADQKAYAWQSERQLIELACAVAKKIIQKELETDPAWVERTLKSALAELVDRSRVEVHANPEDIPFLLTVRDDLAVGYPPPVELQFVSDLSVEKGGCILRTRHGSVDARIDTQLNEVKRALLEAAAAHLRE
ncbi:FliH/SctL family protein [Effusibacillus pohliae]|uniref:FliH/SctL family protein n=1 Tax=Effusibacillus pohliae TaxID=232270 RepID=UPI00036E5620|nr:FliH/SctL family protein [Effusibacillus pohliae]